MVYTICLAIINIRWRAAAGLWLVKHNLELANFELKSSGYFVVIVAGSSLDE